MLLSCYVPRATERSPNFGIKSEQVKHYFGNDLHSAYCRFTIVLRLGDTFISFYSYLSFLPFPLLHFSVGPCFNFSGPALELALFQEPRFIIYFQCIGIFYYHLSAYEQSFFIFINIITPLFTLPFAQLVFTLSAQPILYLTIFQYLPNSQPETELSYVLPSHSCLKLFSSFQVSFPPSFLMNPLPTPSHSPFSPPQPLHFHYYRLSSSSSFLPKLLSLGRTFASFLTFPFILFFEDFPLFQYPLLLLIDFLSVVILLSQIVLTFIFILHYIHIGLLLRSVFLRAYSATYWMGLSQNSCTRFPPLLNITFFQTLFFSFAFLFWVLSANFLQHSYCKKAPDEHISFFLTQASYFPLRPTFHWNTISSMYPETWKHQIRDTNSGVVAFYYRVWAYHIPHQFASEFIESLVLFHDIVYNYKFFWTSKSQQRLSDYFLLFCIFCLLFCVFWL